MTKKLFVSTVALMLTLGSTVWAADPKKDAKKPAPVDNYNELFARYLEAARHQPSVSAPDPASWMNTLMMDSRARHLNDLVTVRVIESITASGTADSAVTKSSTAGIGIPNLLGLEKTLAKVADPANLINAKQNTTFAGTGSTDRASALTATISARVSEVLPNGDLVIEGVREIEINGEKQLLVLSGVARVADIGPGNVVLSTTLGQLSIKYFGSGLMKDSLSPGWLVRMLNKVF
jgi:flagellar L-ring protein precursor FlgH